MVLVDDRDVAANAHVLVDDRALHRGALADADRGAAALPQHGPLLTGLEVVGPHHQAVLQNHLVFDPGSHSKHTVVNAAGPQHRAFADDRLGDLGVEQLARGQVAGAGVDREFLVVKGEGRVGLVGEGHVGLIEGPDRADVLPVVVKEVGLQSVAPL